MLLMPALQRLTPALPAPLSSRLPDWATLVPLPDPRPQLEAPSVSSAVAPANVVGRTVVQPSAASSPTPQPASVSRISRLRVAASVYALIAVALLLRVVLALGTVWAIYRGARPIGDGLFEYESRRHPVTVGLIHPRIVLPATWTDWSDTTRRAVVAHERGHADRRDPLVALLTRVNACVFWFHPLAWRLEQTLADAAEQACDEVGVRAVPNPRQYAEVLLAMAAASRQAGGRIVWAGVSVEGRGRLSHRIDRILLGQKTTTISHAQKLLVVSGCVAAVTAAVACRSQPAAPSPACRGGNTPTRRTAERGRAIPSRPHSRSRDDVGAGRRARGAVATQSGGSRGAREASSSSTSPTSPANTRRTIPEKIAGRRPLILWLIEHHPDSELIRRIPGRIFPPGDWLPDPQG